ncbi:MAG: hypothetical protein ACO3A8_05560 [Steroidobacteraceae bacterium]|jgi:hypothetical protein
MLTTPEVIFGMVGLFVLLVGAIGYWGLKTLLAIRLERERGRAQNPERAP